MKKCKNLNREHLDDLYEVKLGVAIVEEGLDRLRKVMTLDEYTDFEASFQEIISQLTRIEASWLIGRSKDASR